MDYPHLRQAGRAGRVYCENLSSQCAGGDAPFLTTRHPYEKSTLKVYRNGTRLNSGSYASDYGLYRTILFIVNPIPAGSTVWVTYRPMDVSNTWFNAGVPLGSCIVAYQPVWAPSQEASYLNLASPGEYDLQEAGDGSPEWTNITGWKFKPYAVQSYLKTGFKVPADARYSYLIRYVNASYRIFGTMGIKSYGAYIYLDIGAKGSSRAGNGTGEDIYSIADWNPTAVVGISDRVYVNGSPLTDSAVFTHSAAESGVDIILGGAQAHYGAVYYGTVEMLAFAIYTRILSASEMASVSSKMAGL